MTLQETGRTERLLLTAQVTSTSLQIGVSLLTEHGSIVSVLTNVYLAVTDCKT